MRLSGQTGEREDFSSHPSTITIISVILVAVMESTITVIFPVAEPGKTFAAIIVSTLLMTCMAVSFTLRMLLAGIGEKPLPRIVTVSPMCTESGLKEII